MTAKNSLFVTIEINSGRWSEEPMVSATMKVSPEEYNKILGKLSPVGTSEVDGQPEFWGAFNGYEAILRPHSVTVTLTEPVENVVLDEAGFLFLTAIQELTADPKKKEAKKKPHKTK